MLFKKFYFIVNFFKLYFYIYSEMYIFLLLNLFLNSFFNFFNIKKLFFLILVFIHTFTRKKLHIFYAPNIILLLFFFFFKLNSKYLLHIKVNI